VAISLTLLVAAAMVLRSLQEANRIDVGFPSERLAILTLNLGMHGYDSRRATQFYEALVERYQSLPEVDSASYTTRLPFTLNIFVYDLYPGPQNPDQKPIAVDVSMIAPGYFETLGVRLIEGRSIEGSDRADAPPVAVVNEAAADLFWPGENPLGKQLTRDDGPTYQVVGVSENHKVRTVSEVPRPLVSFSILQLRSTYAEILVRTRSAAAGVLETLRREAAILEPDLAIMESTTMERRLALSLFAVKVGAGLLSIFGLFALFLASVGVYGVMAYSVAARTREIGTRMALGARERDVLRATMRESLGMTLAGIVVGLVLSALLGQLLTSLLYGVSPFDPSSFAGGALVLFGAALLAAYVPARRAARVDPLVALRCE
jgi:predicted permease